jgi:enoyl-CoA hydratase
MNDPVTFDSDGTVARITIDDGKVNAFSTATLRAIHEAFDRADEEDAIVLLSGREGCFSAGFDLGVLAGGGDAVREMVGLGATLAERILARPRPVVVACTGHALPAGAFLLLSADRRIGAEGPFRIGLNEVRIGLTVPRFAVEVARQRLHPAYFDRTVATGELFGPDEALVAGFLDRVVPASELADTAAAAALELTALDADAHAASKLRARAGALAAVRTAIEADLEMPAAGLAVGARAA